MSIYSDYRASENSSLSYECSMEPVKPGTEKKLSLRDKLPPKSRHTAARVRKILTRKIAQIGNALILRDGHAAPQGIQ